VHEQSPVMPSSDDEQVAVIIAARNAGATIGQALASVAAQLMPPDVVVLVDDVSDDDTLEQARMWSDRLPLQIEQLPQPGGPSVARDYGIRATSTPLVAILDADDVWLPDHLSSMVAAYRRSPGLVTARPLPWVPGEAVVSGERRSPVPAPHEQLAQLLRTNFVFYGTLFPRSAYDRAGGYRPQYRWGEDWDLWIRMRRAGTVISACETPTVLYRLSPDSLGAQDARIRDELDVLRTAVREAATDDERQAATRGLRTLTGHSSLVLSYQAARQGLPWRARRYAIAAFRGTPRVAARAVFMALAPRTGVRIADRQRDRARWIVR